jgi:hypothetical protein
MADLFIKGMYPSLGISNEATAMILKQAASHPQACPLGGIKESDSSWFAPQLDCTVKFMMRTIDGLMRQPMFKVLSMDKASEKFIVK